MGGKVENPTEQGTVGSPEKGGVAGSSQVDFTEQSSVTSTCDLGFMEHSGVNPTYYIINYNIIKT